MRKLHYDVAIVGGGLSGGLTAMALARLRPDVRIVLVEAGDSIGGNHLWSYFSSDIAPEHRWLTAPLISHGWAGNQVHFPDFSRKLRQNYYTIESERLDEQVRAALPADALLLGQKVLACGPTSVVLEDGRRIEAGAVIDARGPADLAALQCGWQKFVGQTLELAEPHNLTQPVIMDARVEQIDGYRFVYLLPFSPVHLFVEDTYYSDTPDLDIPELQARIAAYAKRNHWKINRVTRQEAGVLPVVKGGDFDAYWRAGGDKVPKVGARGGFFHPVTSYSLPDAVRTAMAVAESDDLSAPALNAMLKAQAAAVWKRGKFFFLLNTMLFDAATTEDRFKILQRHYSLSEPLVERFYSGQTSGRDMARILAGKPPIPISRAVRAIVSRRNTQTS